MSRTFKDRPYWVRTNDEHEPRDVFHDHLSFGRPVYRTVPVTDEAGATLTEIGSTEITAGYHIYMISGGVRYYSAFKWYRVRKSLEAEVLSVAPVMKTISWERPVTGRKLIGYVASHCTGDEPMTKQDPDGWFRPCSPSLEYRRETILKSNRKLYHRVSRAQEQRGLKALTRFADNGESYDDAWDVSLTRQQFHPEW